MKRYDSYKDSGVDWIRDIPKEWKIIRGKYVFQNIKEINNQNQENNLLSLTLKGVLNKDINSNEGLRPTEYSTYQIFEKDDLVFKLIDLENTQTSRVGLVHERGIMSPVYIRLKPQVTINPKYSFYYFYNLYKQHIYNFLGSGVRSSLTPSNLLEIELTLPPLSEQQQIVSFLDSKTSQIDELIQKKERKIELLKEYRTSLINQVVTKGLNLNVEMKDSGVEWIGEIPSHWLFTKFNRYVFFQEGPGLRTFQFTDEGTKVICVTNITENGIDFTYKKFISTDEYFEKYQHFTVEKGDFLLSSSGNSWGKVSEYLDDEKVMLNTSTIRLNTLNSSMYNKSLIPHILKSEVVRKQLEILMTGSCQPNFGPSHLNQLVIPVPPLPEQQQIVEYLDEQTQLIDNTISIEEKRIELLKEYRQSLISEVVTGKIDVRLN